MPRQLPDMTPEQQAELERLSPIRPESRAAMNTVLDALEGRRLCPPSADERRDPGHRGRLHGRVDGRAGRHLARGIDTAAGRQHSCPLRLPSRRAVPHGSGGADAPAFDDRGLDRAQEREAMTPTPEFTRALERAHDRYDNADQDRDAALLDLAELLAQGRADLRVTKTSASGWRARRWIALAALIVRRSSTWGSTLALATALC